MKKFLSFLIIFSLCGLTGCAKYPSKALDGTAWDKSWEMLGSVVGVEKPGDNLTLSKNNSVLTGDDLYYATWTIGTPTPYTNEDGKEVELYTAQLYALLEGCGDGAYAQKELDKWMEKEKTGYNVTDTITETRNGREYTILVYTCGSDTNPYSRGISAFTVFDNYAFNVELTCQDSYTGNEKDVLLRFLDGCHFNREED